VLMVISGTQASPLRYPKRLINGQMVDLSPLWRWWTNHTGVRPLSAWVHVTGSVQGTNSWGWIVEGQAEPGTVRSETGEGKVPESGGLHKILLLHPPLQDITEFQQLSAQLRALSESRAQLAGQEAGVKSRQQAVAKEQSAEHHSRVRARALGQENKELTALDNQEKAQIKLLDQQIQLLKNRLAAYPNSDHYVVDCFALDTGREENGVSVYEHGSIFQY